MLKPIHLVPCSPALAACQRLMHTMVLWLCNPATNATTITWANLQPPIVPSAIEANWLWNFLQKIESRKPLLERAKILAGMPTAKKSALLSWMQSVSTLANQFQANPPAWPVDRPNISKQAWKAFRELLEAFYEKGLRSGLPYQPDGTPVTSSGVSYASFVQSFRDSHRLNSNQNAREVCVLCGGPLGQTPEVDHWIAKSAYPLLSVCADNLLPICGDCNSTANKGGKDVHSAGTFTDWFHPYLRPGNANLRIGYVLPALAITCAAPNPADQRKIDNLNNLLNLTVRWTREFKAEYAKHQDVLRRRERDRVQQGATGHTQSEVQAYLQQFRADLVPSEPHYDVHLVLSSAMLEQARLAAWHSELGLAS